MAHHSSSKEEEPLTPPLPGVPGRGEWAPKQFGKRWQHRLFYWFIRLGGRARGYHMGNIAAAWYVLTSPALRARCRPYLERRFPDRRGVKHLYDTFRLFRSYAETLVDMLIMTMFGESSLQVSSPQHGPLRAICANPRGFVLLHAHVGCWQVGMSTLGAFGKRASIVMIPEPRTTSLFDPNIATAIDPRGGLPAVMDMTQTLLRGDVLTMMGDRAFGDDKNTVDVKFLGGLVAIPVTPYRLASATGVPVLVMMAPRIKRGVYEMRLMTVIDVPANLGRDASVYRPYAQQFADCLERFATEFPWQFANFYDLWRSEPTAL